MPVQDICTIIGSVIAAIAFLLKLYDRNPRSFVGCLKKVINALIEGIPFALISCHLPTAIIVFTAVRIYNLFIEIKKPNLCVEDSLWAMLLLCLQTGMFATVIACIK